MVVQDWDSMFDDILDRLDKDYPLEALMKKDLSEVDRLEIIHKRELIESIRDMIKGVKE